MSGQARTYWEGELLANIWKRRDIKPYSCQGKCVPWRWNSLCRGPGVLEGQQGGWNGMNENMWMKTRKGLRERPVGGPCNNPAYGSRGGDGEHSDSGFILSRWRLQNSWWFDNEMEEKEKHQECLQCVSLSSCKGGDDTAAPLWQNRLRRSLFLCRLALISRPVKLESRLWTLIQLPGTCRSKKLALISQSRLMHFFLPSIKNVRKGLTQQVAGCLPKFFAFSMLIEFQPDTWPPTRDYISQPPFQLDVVIWLLGTNGMWAERKCTTSCLKANHLF